jgi:hypothetical protein
MVGMVDSEHVVFVGRDPEKVAEAVEVSEADRIEWVPLASVPELIRHRCPTCTAGPWQAG